MEHKCEPGSPPEPPPEPPPDHLPPPAWSPLVSSIPWGVPPVPPRGPPPEPPESKFNVVATVSQWADDNLCLIRNISTAMAIAGFFLFGRSIKLTSKFVSPLDIPAEFMKKNVKLRGRLRRITERGLELEHIPIYIPLISTWRNQPSGVLLVKLAGVELTEAGQLWLRKELRPYQMLWFQLMTRDSTSLFCLLLVNRGMYFTINLNEDILRRGLGKTVLIQGLDQRMFWKVHKRLLRAELSAVKNREGIWKEETEKWSYIENFKGSWREIWSKDNTFEIPTLWKLNPKEGLTYKMLRSYYGRYKNKVSNSIFVLKVREFLSRVKLGKRQ